MSIKVSFDYIQPEMKVNFDDFVDKVKDIDKMINDRSGLGSYYLP